MPPIAKSYTQKLEASTLKSRGYYPTTIIQRRQEYIIGDAPQAGAATSYGLADRGMRAVAALLRRAATVVAGLLSYWRGA